MPRSSDTEGAAALEATPPAVDIGSLRDGDRVDGLLACARQALVSLRGGSEFLVVVLRDGERKIQARAFARAHQLAGQFGRGDVVHVRGRVATYRGELQIKLQEIVRHRSTPALELLPVAYRNLDELDGFLEHLAREVYDPSYALLVDSLLGDRALREAFRMAPCSSRGHHAYLGGLLEHTVAVTTMALELTIQHARLDSDLLLTAGLVHDVGHTRGFTYSSAILDSAAGQTLGHIELGLEILREHAQRVGLAQRPWQSLAHCVLTHHGPSTSSGPLFASAEAQALRRLVALDEDVKQALESVGTE